MDAPSGYCGISCKPDLRPQMPYPHGSVPHERWAHVLHGNLDEDVDVLPASNSLVAGHSYPDDHAYDPSFA